MSEMKNQYRTTDLWLAGFLKAKGLKIIDLERRNNRSTFVFEYESDIQNLLRDFFNDGLIRITAFKNAIQDIKTMLHNF